MHPASPALPARDASGQRPLVSQLLVSGEGACDQTGALHAYLDRSPARNGAALAVVDLLAMRIRVVGQEVVRAELVADRVEDLAEVGLGRDVEHLAAAGAR